MSPASVTFEIPQRHSLSAQAADALRRAIQQGAWQGSLPGERRLCDLLKVSRTTIRTTLQTLARDGLIEIRHRRRNRLLSFEHRPPAANSRLVVLVSPEPITHLSSSAYAAVSDMRTCLAERGFTTEVLVCQARSKTARLHRLERFVRQNPVLCCLLLSVGRELQEWFMAHALPALVHGSCHPGVRLPSLDVDYRAVCRHAAVLLRRKGHRRIALIVPDSGAAGDLVSEEAFRAAVLAAPAEEGSQASVVRHDGTPEHLYNKLDGLFSAQRFPTALMVAKPPHTFLVAIYLMKRGLKVPDDVSLIARDQDHLFEGTISHYRFRREAFSNRLTRLMLQLAVDGHIPAEPHLIIPNYVSGGTVRQLM
jgi:DNA-binding LacI/PurR family transcriptional regulator